VTVTELVASTAKPSPSAVPIGNALVHPAMAPVPVSVGNRRFALLAAQDATGSGVGVLRVERTGSAATAPQTVIGPDPNVAVGAPITAASDGTDILVAGIGRDSLLRVAKVSAGQVTSPATWQSTGIKCHPFSRVSLRARGPSSGAAIIVDPNRAVAVAKWEPATPWPPRTAAALPSSTALGTSPLCLAVSGGRFVILFIGADLKLYFSWEYSPGAWTTPNPVTSEILCPHSSLAVGEGQGALEILALREDLYLQLYRLIPGVGATATPATWFTPSAPATGGTAFQRAPNPFGDLGAAQVGSDRIVVFQALVNPPRPATGSSSATRVPDVFGGVSYARQASPPTAAAGWVDLF
jgi:hypothetical protein